MLSQCNGRINASQLLEFSVGSHFRRTISARTNNPAGRSRRVTPPGMAAAMQFHRAQESFGNRAAVPCSFRRSTTGSRCAGLTRLDMSDLRRTGSTPVLLWYSLSTLTCRSSSFSTSLRESPRAVIARISSKLETAARETPGTGRLGVIGGLGVEEIRGAEMCACARRKRLLINETSAPPQAPPGRKCQVVRVHAPIVSQPEP